MNLILRKWESYFIYAIPIVEGVWGNLTTTEHFMYICNSKARDIFLGRMYGYKMLLQVIALVFASSTRKVKVKDAKYITAATYMTSSVLAVDVVATYSMKDFVNAFPALHWVPHWHHLHPGTFLFFTEGI